MDGRVQLPVIHFLQQKYHTRYVDMITEPGPNRILADQPDSPLFRSILKRLDISVNLHGSEIVAIVGHHDCAGNPSPKATQLLQIKQSIANISKLYPKIEMVGLWIDEKWKVHVV
jgi:hypothetical protein